jgi:hypothetical protein
MSQLENNMHNGVIIFSSPLLFQQVELYKTLDWMVQFVCTRLSKKKKIVCTDVNYYIFFPSIYTVF